MIFLEDYDIFVPFTDQIPYVEYGSYVAYNNEKGGVIQCLKNDRIVDLDSDVSLIPEWVSTKAMVESWLAEAVMYELWVVPDGTSAHKIYFSDLPWPIGKLLYLKKIHKVKQLLGINKDNAERREEEVHYFFMLFLFCRCELRNLKCSLQVVWASKAYCSFSILDRSTPGLQLLIVLYQLS